MFYGINRKYLSAVASLALTAGAALADDAKEQLDMEVVAVVEKFEPAPMSTKDYFRQAATGVVPELDRMLAASVNSNFQWLSERLESRGETRMAAVDALVAPITVASASSGATSKRAAM